jgi:hypothetical protein
MRGSRELEVDSPPVRCLHCLQDASTGVESRPSIQSFCVEDNEDYALLFIS